MRFEDRILPYMKAAIRDDNAPALQLSHDESPLLEPFVGQLLVSYVVDEGDELRFLTHRDLLRHRASLIDVRRAAHANLSNKVAATGVRLARHGHIQTVLFDGNFEATLLLCGHLWSDVHVQFGPELVAVAPARDVLAVSAPSYVEELQGVIDRVWPNGDHLLTREVYRCANGSWTLYLS